MESSNESKAKRREGGYQVKWRNKDRNRCRGGIEIRDKKRTRNSGERKRERETKGENK